MERWEGKVAIVTGASSGIGEGIAKELVKHGLKVVGLARRVERIEKLARTLSEEKGKLYAIKADISEEKDILNAFEWTLDNLGPINILVNNAGVTGSDIGLINGKTESWKQVMDVNVMGLCIATREAVQSMLKRKIDGHIIHINSICGHYMSMSAIYGASKFGVTQLTEALRKELIEAKSKIRITSISPGVVDTEILEKSGRMELLDPMPKLKPEDIAASVIHAIAAPPHVQIHEMIIRPVGEII